MASAIFHHHNDDDQVHKQTSSCVIVRGHRVHAQRRRRLGDERPRKLLKPCVLTVVAVLLLAALMALFAYLDRLSSPVLFTTTTTTTTSADTDPLQPIVQPQSPSPLEQFEWQRTCGQTSVEPSIDLENVFGRSKSSSTTNRNQHQHQHQHHHHHHSRRHKRIIGGQDARTNSWPFLVSIRIKTPSTPQSSNSSSSTNTNRTSSSSSEHHCGGALISDQHVITAAHCLMVYFSLVDTLHLNISQIFSLMEVSVGLNNHNNNNNGSNDKQQQQQHHADVYSVQYFDLHHAFNFNQWILVHDIAMLKLSRRVDLGRPEVNAVCLPSSPSVLTHYKRVSKGDRVVAVGWGAYAEEYNYLSYVKNELQQAVFTVHDPADDVCNQGMIGKKWNREFTVCADGGGDGAARHRMVTCYGDSGGPVLVYQHERWILVGIISFGHDVRDEHTKKKKCNASMPFYFVKIDEYQEWIQREIASDLQASA